ncbi:thioredoxin reductase 1, cytoplasmic-like [Babylonia areolata]|uniref:thioredoxin reductase 1, cytoplasmic-like n=1 Tax=Babylonia areolata TaxID=304850 RepID=UPI003FCFAFF7
MLFPFLVFFVSQCDYMSVPTTVFTPIEYGAIGYAEEDAIEKFGDDNIEVYHSNFMPLEWTVPHREENACYAKLICNKAENERVIGFHVVGPNAGEITQGYSVAMRKAATKEDFDATIGIHPTCSEVWCMQAAETDVIVRFSQVDLKTLESFLQKVEEVTQEEFELGRGLCPSRDAPL